MRLVRQLSFVLGTAIALCGCAGYRLGPATGAAPGAKSIHVQPFANRTMEPGLADPLVAALRKQLQRDGTYRLTAQADADLVLGGEIIEYKRAELSYNPADAVSTLDYRLTITARAVARERSTGRQILDKQFQASTLVRVGADLATAERQALPLLAESLAKRITDALVDGDWEDAAPPSQ
ncbi:MAG: LPS assembly lipoprotein LptE [Verrucomicrobiae bacterium]|nr:LPS assembly lipoprotein LptE [Verrucomicrobiae bacterium]